MSQHHQGCPIDSVPGQPIVWLLLPIYQWPSCRHHETAERPLGSPGGSHQKPSITAANGASAIHTPMPTITFLARHIQAGTKWAEKLQTTFADVIFSMKMSYILNKILLKCSLWQIALVEITLIRWQNHDVNEWCQHLWKNLHIIRPQWVNPFKSSHKIKPAILNTLGYSTKCDSKSIISWTELRTGWSPAQEITCCLGLI